MRKIHHRACTLCEAMCGIVVETEGTRVHSIRGDKDDPLSRGHICPKAVALQDLQDDPDRLRGPMRRTANGWEPISWKAAFDETAGRLKAVQKAHGRDAVAVYLGNPTVHNYGSMLYGPNFMRALGTRNRYSATSVDQLPHSLAAFLMFGHQLLLAVPDIERTRYMLILGANPAASNGSLMSAPGVEDRLKAIRARGGKVVLIDPRRTETARAVDTHHFIRPGSDPLLLAALLQVIFAEGLERPGRLAEMAKGMDSLRAAVQDFTPETVAPHTGIGAAAIRTLAREFAQAEAAVCYGRFGTSTALFGGIAHWLINALNIVTGNLDREGGAMFTLPAVDVVGGGLVGAGGYGHGKSRVRGLSKFGGEFPAAVLAEEILTAGDGQIRALVTSAGNPVLSTPNGGQLDRALASLDFMVSVDFYLNETTRHAHIILPPTAPLEHDHYDVVMNLLAVRHTAKYSPSVFDPPSGAMHDWEIFAELQSRIDKPTAANRIKNAVLRRTGPQAMLAVLLRAGPYGARFKPFGGGLTLQKVKKSVHGVDLGPLEPLLPGRLFTHDKKIDLAPQAYLEDLSRLRKHFFASPEAAEGYDLQLIGRRHVRSNNSWMHNSERLVKGKPRCTLLMHPDDARQRNLADGAWARLCSRTGSVEAPVEISDAMMPGVVSLPHGWGHNVPGIRMRVAAEHAGVSVNHVTDDQLVDLLAGTAVLNGVPVRVEAAATREQGEMHA